MKELIEIQTALKVPKGQYNSFGKYAYRSLEDIMLAVKPLLAEAKCLLTVTDCVELIGDRYYVKAQATIRNETGEMLQTIGISREPESKKGMDPSQITGSCSSYARKIALNGMFCIDDSKDADTVDNTEEGQPEPPKAPKKKSLAEVQLSAISGNLKTACWHVGIPKADYISHLLGREINRLNVDTITEDEVFVLREAVQEVMAEIQKETK